ncbi:MAG TPA: hypothetical protein VJ866_10210 [Pyrinomonadaceae bacterium]|nr:hypothetical protein [Pyrinomonadaceae bacterium]
MPREEEFQAFEQNVAGPGEAEAARPFAHAEMVACEQCLRANAPTRMTCMYCGAALPVTEQSAALRRPTLKKLEEWERGFNVVLLPREGLKTDAVEEAAVLLRLEASRLAEIVASGRALPLARAASMEEAELVVSRLRALGIIAEVFADEVLTRAPERVRALEFEEGALICRQGPEAEPRRVPFEEVALLVAGRIVERRVEVEERKTRFGSRSEVVEARELASDELVLDVFTTGEGTAFRVMSGGFDYSCLGASKGLLAAENFGRLVATLRGLAKAATFDDEYTRLRPLLADVWPPAEHTASLGLVGAGGGRVNTGAVTKVSNEAQFTRYARLLQSLGAKSS